MTERQPHPELVNDGPPDKGFEASIPTAAGNKGQPDRRSPVEGLVLALWKVGPCGCT